MIKPTENDWNTITPIPWTPPLTTPTTPVQRMIVQLKKRIERLELEIMFSEKLRRKQIDALQRKLNQSEEGGLP